MVARMHTIYNEHGDRTCSDCCDVHTFLVPTMVPAQSARASRRIAFASQEGKVTDLVSKVLAVNMAV